MVGIIGAMKSEITGLTEIAENVSVERFSSKEFVKATIGGESVVIAEAGIGKVNAAVTAQVMIMRYRPECIVNIGVAGGLDAGLRIGDVVVADRVVESDLDTSPVGDPVGYISGLDTVYIDCDKTIVRLLCESAKEVGINVVCSTIASGDQFVCTDEQRERIIRLFGAAAVEMEGAAIGHVCALNNVPFGVLRAISDGANDDSVVDYPKFCRRAAANSVRIIKLVLTKRAESGSDKEEEEK